MTEHLSPVQIIRKEHAADNLRALVELQHITAVGLESNTDGLSLAQSSNRIDERVGLPQDDIEELREAKARLAASRLAAMTTHPQLYK